MLNGMLQLRKKSSNGFYKLLLQAKVAFCRGYLSVLLFKRCPSEMQNIMLVTLNNLLPFAYIVLRSIDMNKNSIHLKLQLDYYNDAIKKSIFLKT
ncbi:hypothetical protein T10_3546 [Trichinella papuae]|uniref:Uncharacterized protein n=1 Tax=Trichinella papuae TaxID=268474 RepID=A0A0V1M7K2_9BILA|nr:hypothetical protein T10_12275 [Trichinella papuae]KRZ67767.1 hypothetical protein T10_10949 [Trichinella papuae]KRZ67780.1 hypothetical protein T10_3546 [Trichinella papuae]